MPAAEIPMKRAKMGSRVLDWEVLAGCGGEGGEGGEGVEGRERREEGDGKVRGGGKEGGTWILDSCSEGSSRPCWVEVGSWRSVVLRVRLRLWVHSWSRAASLRYGPSILGIF